MLGSFGSVSLLCKKPCSITFNALILAGTKMMLRFGPETKRTHPIHLFGPNSVVLVHFGQFCYCAKKHTGDAFNALIRAMNKTMQFWAKIKRTHPIHFFGPNSDVLVR